MSADLTSRLEALRVAYPILLPEEGEPDWQHGWNQCLDKVLTVLRECPPSAIRTNFHGNVSLIDGIPHRPCDCPKDQGKCARGFPRTLLTTEFSRCMVPV
jgi:hypothetical protein